MRIKFSNSWKASSQKRKQVKYTKNAPLHTKSKLVSAHLSKDLAAKHGTRSVSVRKGDKLKLVRGSFKGKTGKVTRVDMKNTKVFIEGVELSKVDGSKAQVAIHPSNCVVVELALEDKKRSKSLSRAKEKKKE